MFDTEHPIRSTGEMLPWYTGRPWEDTIRSQINRCVYDSTWEASEAARLERHAEVAAWAKNDHLGFEVNYVHGGVVRKYRPDFLVRLRSGATLVIEMKGQESEQTAVKHRALDEWTRAVNEHGGFGRWSWGVARSPSAVVDVIERHLRSAAGDSLAQQYGIRPGSEVEFVPGGDVIRLLTSASRPPAGVEERLKLFDEATNRQRRRQVAFHARRRHPRDRGWTREGLYRRGVSR